jgi:cell division protein FtsZ
LEQTIHGAKGLLVNMTSSEDLTLAEANEAMQFIQGLCDADEANIFFGTVIDPELDGTVRVTVLATGFNPYTKEGKKVAEAVYNGEHKAAVAVPVPEPAVAAVATSAEVVAQVRERIQQASNRGAAPDPSAIFNETDLDIPAFIREHRQR